MGLKQFNLDLRAAASSCDDPHVTNVRKGDSDGEIVFTYTLEGQLPLEIQALTTESDAYPRHSSFLIFTSSDHATKDMDGWLQDFAASTQGKNVTDVISLVSRRLTAKLSNSTGDPAITVISSDEEGEEEEEEEAGDSAFDSDDFSAIDEDEEEYRIDIDPLPPRRPATVCATGSPESMLRLKRHLREAKKEGFCISVPFTKKGDNFSGIFSLSIRVSKLGIPEEALEAWDLKSSECVVMLIRLPMGYPSAHSFMCLPSDQSTVQFRFGKCASPKPSYHTMRRMFDSEQATESQRPLHEDEGKGSDHFLPLYMSASLNPLLNQDFPSLLRLRRSESFSWDQAQAFKFDLSRGSHYKKSSDLANSSRGDQNGHTDWFSFEFLRRDYISAGDEDLNIFLVAMQFGLQRLIKCTKYCMVCHQRMDGGFEAVKPFVCGNLLCLYQYLSLGFGQSIEHDIINNPAVVDLLISFFYSAVYSNRLRQFPQGLGLKWVDPGSLKDPSEHLEVEVRFMEKKILFSGADYGSFKKMKEGEYVLLVIKPKDMTPATPIMYSNIERHTCVIDSLGDSECTFRIIETHTAPMNTLQLGENAVQTHATHPGPDRVRVMLFQHTKDIDELQSTDRNYKLMQLARMIPSVDAMRSYLLGRPGSNLSLWKGMDSSTLSLLNWIVASNRSFIVQDGPIPGSTVRGTANSPNLVQGMGDGWMQFRFAQGSPEKEEAFFKELTKLKDSNGQPKTYPSLFAWHGSPLENWHSIIRTGLDFSTTLHGRAYGNGVYLSKEFATSQGYSRGGVHGVHLDTSAWPNSRLKISNAISMCEIVNDPAKYVSTQPHFVIDKIEWIQCRYLFVQVHAVTQGGSQWPPKEAVQDSQGYLNQDPQHQLVSGGRDGIRIPLSAIPTARRRAFGQQVAAGGPGITRGNPILLDGADEGISEEMDGELDDLLASDEEDEDGGQRQTVRKRRRTSTDSGLGELRPSKLTTAMQDLRNAGGQPLAGSTTAFVPGSLDLSSLPKLADPTWAASSPGALRALNREIKDLQKMQSGSDMAALGWYIDFDKLDNMFHWIVELHSFDVNLPLAKDMKRAGCSSIVLELRFGSSYPISPPFVRVIRPRFLPFAQGGGGHVTAGGAICSELLTNSGWSPALSLEKVLLEVRMNLCEIDPPARLDRSSSGFGGMDYNIYEAIDAFRRAATAHGWEIPSDVAMISSMATAQA